ncbi:FAD binding domain-containing protein [Rhodovulum euryhalinum]|uniref:CO/xanthine dehydrogenase FAD-binding subunit n=1 Tax=Rhodovulum euryhalinum TaxID=35805 RepID=A0A4R2KBC9_9RHOB|nr:FAD binding domain-containing protein [Rhodovulum euryhalinum]TCO70773.1 CO/xanthine dehydrogenase FAD-binding subunit [Rhodovulum euryhalinum]
MAPYLRPRTLAEALEALAGGGLRVAAGCTDLFPATRGPGLSGGILDITAIEGLRGIGESAAGWRIGATTSWAEIARAGLPPGFDGLRAAAREVGSVQVQTAGTVGGNLVNASPAADGAPCWLVLDAEVELASHRGTRRLAVADFLTGPRQTARAADELLTAIHVPRAAGAGQGAFLKLGARRYLVISIAMAAVRLDIQAGRVAHAALAVGACSATARRLPDAEAALRGRRADAGLADAITAGIVARALAPIDDHRAPAAYRTRAALTLLRRAVAGLCAERAVA